MNYSYKDRFTTMKKKIAQCKKFLFFMLLIICSLFFCSQTTADSTGIVSETKTVKVNGKDFTVNLVKIPLKDYKIKVGIANGKVGATESLKGIAERYGAVAAINGCFFSAYKENVIKPPYHNLISDGKVLHIGDVGTTLGFNSSGKYAMDTVEIRIRGTAERKPIDPYTYEWYASSVNHDAEQANAAIMYTPHWINDKTPDNGSYVVICDGKVDKLGFGSQLIPDNGYVLFFTGGESYLYKRFRMGMNCLYNVTFEGKDRDFWKGVTEGIGCGPRLVKSGRVAVDSKSEGFVDPKILVNPGTRSAVGITKDNMMLLVTCKSATITELASIMQSLGAYDAMNLDGGASSCLWADGKYVSVPGRDISNALLVLKK
jgi:hypothetical protein